MSSSDYRHLIWWLFLIGLGIDVLLAVAAAIASHMEGEETRRKREPVKTQRLKRIKKRCVEWIAVIACVLIFLAVIFERPLELLEAQEKLGESNRVAQLSVALTDARSSLADATGRLAQTEAHLNSAEIKLEATEAKLRPRRLTLDQKKALVNALTNAPKGKVLIEIDMNAPDGKELAQDFAEVFSLVHIPFFSRFLSSPLYDGVVIGGVPQHPFAVFLYNACRTNRIADSSTPMCETGIDAELVIARKKNSTP